MRVILQVRKVTGSSGNFIGLNDNMFFNISGLDEGDLRGQAKSPDGVEGHLTSQANRGLILEIRKVTGVVALAFNSDF